LLAQAWHRLPAAVPEPLIPQEGLLLDLDASRGVVPEDGGRVGKWVNQVVTNGAREFLPQDKGRTERGSGRPTLRTDVKELGGKSSVVFRQQELVCADEDTFDRLTTGQGHTWVVLMALDEQRVGLKDVNSFFGNLRNDGKYEGLWGCVNDDNTVWYGARNGVTFGRFDANNPQAIGPKLERGKWHVIAGRMAAGTGLVKLELFVDRPSAVASVNFPVSVEANPSRMVIGQERDAFEHPGKESFDGEIARLLIWSRPLSDEELASTLRLLAVNSPRAQRAVWTGAGRDDLWSTGANWSTGQPPGASDDVVLNGSSAKNSKWDANFVVKSLTVRPEYKGVFTIAGAGAVEGNVVLSGRVNITKDPHQRLPFRGTNIDLSGLEELGGSHWRVPRIFDLGGARDDLVQTLTPPTRDIELGEFRFIEKGTVHLGGPLLRCYSIEITGDKTVHLHGQKIDTERFCSAGQLLGLEGAEIHVTGWAEWSPHGIGSSKNEPSKPRAGIIDLAAQKPWKINVENKFIHPYSHADKRGPLTITRSAIANLDASGGEEIVAVGCEDKGGNKNVRFLPKKP